MFRWKIGTIIITLILCFTFLSLENKEAVKEYAIGSINGDGEEYGIALMGKRQRKYGADIVVFSLKDEKKEIYREDFSQLRPWKVAIGDVDGDGVDEISIGVYKKSPLHDVMAKRPFIYSFKDGKLVPKWRGSRLSRPFIDYNFYDIDGDGIDEIISIEILADHRKIINTYKWKGFGFEGYLETINFKNLRGLKVEEKISVEVEEEKEKYVGVVVLEDGELVIERGKE